VAVAERDDVLLALGLGERGGKLVLESIIPVQGTKDTRRGRSVVG